MEKLPIRIRKIREIYKLNQTEISERMNISSSAYGKIERNANKSSYETLLKVANALRVSVKFLLDVNETNYKE
jgi:transcriptional regulator with XRE-family HTH domain